MGVGKCAVVLSGEIEQKIVGDLGAEILVRDMEGR